MFTQILSLKSLTYLRHLQVRKCQLLRPKVDNKFQNVQELSTTAKGPSKPVKPCKPKTPAKPAAAPAKTPAATPAAAAAPSKTPAATPAAAAAPPKTPAAAAAASKGGNDLKGTKKNTPPKNMLTNTKTEFGPLNDCDRIFQNLYGRHDWRLKGACKRGDWYRTADLLEMGADWLLDEAMKSGLRGRGGSGYYVGQKWNHLKESKAKNKMIICNCAEGEPGTCKDREIMRHEPHKIIEGCLLAGVATGSERCIIYVRNRFYQEACNLQFAIAEAYRYGLLGCNVCETGIKFNIQVQRGDRYLTGEETALIKCLMGQLARPRKRPPYLHEQGYFDHPCLVLNTESLAVVPTIMRRGAKWFAGLGRSNNAGTKLFNISGHVNNPCTVEEELSMPLRDIIEMHGGGVCGGWDNLLAVHPGGLSTPLIGPAVAAETLMDFDWLRKANSEMGTGAIIVMCKDCDPLQVMQRSIEFYAHQTCKQCTPCRDGAMWLPEIFKNFTKGESHPHMIDFLQTIRKTMEKSGICSLSDGQANIVRGLVEQFSPVIEQRILDYAKEC